MRNLSIYLLHGDYRYPDLSLRRYSFMYIVICQNNTKQMTVLMYHNGCNLWNHLLEHFSDGARMLRFEGSYAILCAGLEKEM